MTEGVQFDEEQYTIRPPTKQIRETSSMAKWLVRKGVVKNTSQATSLLVVVFFVMAIIAVVVFLVGGGGNNAGPPIDPENDPTLILINDPAGAF